MTGAAGGSVRADNFDLVQAWADSLAQVVGQISGSAVPCAVLAEAPSELGVSSEKDVWMIGSCSGGLRGELALRIGSSSALRAAQMFMSDAAAPGAELPPEHREAVAELLRQVAGAVATEMKTRCGETTLRLDFMPSAPSWPASSISWLRTGADESAALQLELQLSAALVAALRSGSTETAVPPANGTAAPSARESEQESKLALLMDVELALTLRFGGRNLLLRDVLDLSPGAVVELDRQIQDPVDVLLDGRLVARGEVVVVGGNYGLRVTEVLPSAEL
jgi:flagellar motor switch protein FliN